jgi:hypothetical protein
MPAPTNQLEQTIQSVHIDARNRSSVREELALRPEFSTQSSTATNGVTCATRREARVTRLTAGSVSYFYRRYPTGSVAASLSH